MKKTKNKKLKYLWLLLPAAIIITFAVIMIVNSTYDYDPIGRDTMLAEGEKGVLTIMYNGADGMPESKTVEYNKLETIELPNVTKEGYHFSGWSCSWLFVGNKATLNSKTAYAFPQFDKDYSMIKSPCALYSEDFEYDEYDTGEYSNINQNVLDMYLDGGYKMTIYSKPTKGVTQIKL